MKKYAVILMTAALALGSALTAEAGQWQKDGIGWWWQNDDGSYPTGSWQWLDGNEDGVSECYYFNENGYMLENTVTPDGYTVNSEGAWTVNGAVQTQTAVVSTENPVNLTTYEATLWLMGEGLEPMQSTDYYATQALGTDEWFDLYDPTGTFRYTRANKPEWVQYEENFTTCLITGEIFYSPTGVSIKVSSVQPK